MKRKDITTALNTLDSVSELKGVKFAFVVLKNRKKIDTQIEEDRVIFEQILTPSEEFKEFEAKRIELCVSRSDKDENGEAIIENDKYKIQDMEEFNTELTKLSDNYKEFIDARYKQIEEYNSLMEEELDIVFTKVTIDELPEDITEKQLRNLEFMLFID